MLKMNRTRHNETEQYIFLLDVTNILNIVWREIKDNCFMMNDLSLPILPMFKNMLKKDKIPQFDVS